MAAVIRERRQRGLSSDPTAADAVSDLVQDVYLRLLANDRRALRDFRGETEIAVYAYLARIVRAAVGDRTRRDSSQKRHAQTVPLDAGVDGEGSTPLSELLAASDVSSPELQMRERAVPGRLRALLAGGGVPNPERDALVFELHVLEGLSAREIAGIPALDLSLSAVEGVLRRTRERLRERLGNVPDLSA
ncbi:MAG: sigma-70 family RNA polymerase sigma factor [Blastocatellia bacterium]|nr:sigma-70 family RNA polymerase sigma factor [Blastocatellia bacterium]MBK6426764.1 sigma-70 family RNA polymerase sigma factor [Blastocatellia bacterium]